MNEVPGYPGIVVPLVLVTGVLLIFLRPYAGFLFAIAVLTAADVAMFNKTRTALLGPLLNLSDVCVLISLISLFLDKFRAKEPFHLPTIVLLMLAVLTASAIQSFWRLGWTYETIRSFRWGLDVPIALTIGANFVTSPRRARGLIAALFCGAVLAACQHMVFVATTWRTKGLTMETYGLMRTISFWAGCVPAAFLLAAVVWPLSRNRKTRIVCLLAGITFLATVFLNQTRSLWLAVIFSIPIMAFLHNRRNALRTVARIGGVGILAVVLLAVFGQRIMPGLNAFQIISQRFATFLESDPYAAGTISRENAFREEMQNWMEGTLVFGRGLCFFQTIETPQDGPEHAAFGHLGYVTYLSQMGLLGLLAYGLLLPAWVIRNGRCLWLHGDLPEVRFVGLLSTASVLCLSMMFMASSHFLCLGYFAPAILYGGAHSLAGFSRCAHRVSDGDIVTVSERWTNAATSDQHSHSFV
jgi:hypothetical protein